MIHAAPNVQQSNYLPAFFTIDLDLKKLYKNQSCDIAKWLTLFFGLPFLPSNEVEDAYFDLQNLTPDFNLINLSEFFDYAFNNYIIEGCPFPPSIWAEPPTDAPPLQIALNHFTSILTPNFIHPILY
ncbi:Uncharacterized protein FWK35_00007153 [Aphis craccivora]|uniref:MULE domain-containing protein n=1 Tax=Aphis craccivora TaxID=307492 RepID=A0A6G0ZKV9_APHCR|nr:Uncharacterized protein FWK35_00007153 [Aphis craccivora]